MLNRRESLALLSGAALTPWIAALRAAAAPLSYELKPEKITDGVWMVAGRQEAITFANGGAIANITIVDSTAGAIVVDTGPSHRYGDALHKLARKLTGKDVVRVYLTHFHPDHILGNQAFPASVIASTKGVADGMKQLGEAFVQSMYQTVGDWMRGTEFVLPGTILDTEVEDFGNRRFRPLAMRGHTSADLVLFEESTGIILAGDLVFLDRAPTTPHADIERWRISLANLGGIPFSTLVPGHGPAEPSIRGIEQTRQWLEQIETIIKDAFEKGLDVTEAIALPLPAWTEKIAVARYEFERTVMHLYPKLEAERWPQLVESK